MPNKTLGQKILGSKFYPRLPQALFLYVFFFIIFALLWGTDDTSANFGLVSIWILWWPLIPLTFVLLGRVWCAMCPWGALTDWLQSHFSFGLKVPVWIKKHGLWVIFGGFMFLTWYELAFGITSSRLVTATVLLTILALALIVGLLFEKRVWCRYLCPLGGIFGNYSQTAIVEFRGDPDKCGSCKDAYCLAGSASAPGCSLQEFPKNMDSNRLCNVCGDCVKSCENNSPRLSLRLPGKELWEKKEAKFDESFLSALLVGIILISGFGMMEFWINWQEQLSINSGLSKPFITTAAFILFGLASFLLAYLASYFSSKFSGTTALQNFKIFGYALIPLNLATHMAHNLFHFFGEGRNIFKSTIAFFQPQNAMAAEAGAKHMQHSMNSALVGEPVIQALQFLFMAAGTAASVYVAWRIAKKSVGVFVPHLVAILVFTAVSLTMFIFPMAMRH